MSQYPYFLYFPPTQHLNILTSITFTVCVSASPPPHPPKRKKALARWPKLEGSSFGLHGRWKLDTAPFPLDFFTGGYPL